jgi:hypothetical protein
VSQKERSLFWEDIVLVILSKKLYMYMCPIMNGFQDRATSLCSFKIIDKKERLHTVSNTGIYCSSDSWYSLPSIIYFQKFHHQHQRTSTCVRTWHGAHLSASWHSFMRAITSFMWSSSLSCASTFLLYTLLFNQRHKQKSNGVRSEDLGGQLMVLPRPTQRLGKVSLRCCINEKGLGHVESTQQSM